MSIIRVEKNKDYTVMSNHHLRNKNLSLKAKGLMSLMLSLPDDWDYSIDGLVSICKENKTAIQSTLKELEQERYLSRKCTHADNGQFDYEYNLTEIPQTEEPCTEEPCTENPFTVKPCTENQPQLNKDISITKEINTEGINTDLLNTEEYTQPQKKPAKEKQPRHKYGEYGRVLLTDEQLDKLKKEYGEEFIMQAIDRIDEYIQCNNNRNGYTDFYSVIRKAIRQKWSILTDLKGCVIIEDGKNRKGGLLEHLKSKYNI